MVYGPDICIYHDNCDDGFAAAMTVNKKWPGGVDFRPCNYGQPAPDSAIDGKDILIVDFSFPLAVLEPMAERAASIVILDHHKTAQEALSQLHSIVRPTWMNVERCFDRMHGTWREKVLAEFDMGRSGARMAWDFCFPELNPPKLVLAVEDRDLWRFDLPDTKLISMYLRSLPREFGAWKEATELLDVHPAKFIDRAKAIQRYYDLRVGEMAEGAVARDFLGFKNVPVAHVPYAFVSDVCSNLLENHPNAPFAAAIVESYGNTTVSLRSRDDREDVSIIAQRNGGGGHRNAAGFRLAENTAP